MRVLREVPHPCIRIPIYVHTLTHQQRRAVLDTLSGSRVVVFPGGAHVTKSDLSRMARFAPTKSSRAPKKVTQRPCSSALLWSCLPIHRLYSDKAISATCTPRLSCQRADGVLHDSRRFRQEGREWKVGILMGSMSEAVRRSTI